MKYRLNSAEKVPVTLYNVAKTKHTNGRDIVTYSNYIRLVPGEEYETEDKAMIKFFREYRRKVKYKTELAKTLEANGVPFETEMCKSCGGRVKKIAYQIVEVYE